jgi:hypothetical protein
MSLRSELKKLVDLSKCFVQQPRLSMRLLNQLPLVRRGVDYSQHWEPAAAEHSPPVFPEHDQAVPGANPLRVFFDAREAGRGIWKWLHYFDIYHRHFSKFVGRDVTVLEIGVYSGGSLEMWRHYFGPQCRIYGVDVEEACKVYANDHTKIVVGDQGDRSFWKAFKQRVPYVDVLIDDGGHKTEQQIVTLEEMLPHLRPGGVYLCEDLTGIHNGFAAYMHGIIKNLNATIAGNSEAGVCPSAFQTWINSVHFYPYVTVVEKAETAVRQFIAPKHGTEWQPFL